MASQHLWPAGGIIATLLSPFAPAMVDRLVGRVRRIPLVGRIFSFLFPEEEGPHPTQRDVVPQVSLDAESIRLLGDALRGAVQEEVLLAVNRSQLTTEVLEVKEMFRRFFDAERRRQEDALAHTGDTYTVTSTITRVR